MYLQSLGCALCFSELQPLFGTCPRPHTYSYRGIAAEEVLAVRDPPRNWPPKRQTANGICRCRLPFSVCRLGGQFRGGNRHSRFFLGAQEGANSDLRKQAHVVEKYVHIFGTHACMAHIWHTFGIHLACTRKVSYRLKADLLQNIMNL